MASKSAHIRNRMASRNFDEIVYSILVIYGEQLGRRDGLSLPRTTINELIEFARSIDPDSMKHGQSNC